MSNRVKKIIVTLIIFLLCFNININAENLNIEYNNKDVKNELFLSLSIGNGEGKVAYSDYMLDAERFGPESFAILGENEVYILDSVEKQIEIFGADLKHIRTINLPNNSYYDMEVISSDNIILLTYKGEVITINELGNIIDETKINLDNEEDINKQILSKSNDNIVKIKNLAKHTEYNINEKKKYNQIEGVRIVSNECDNLNQKFVYNNNDINIKYKYNAGITYPLKCINDEEVLFFEEEILMGKTLYIESKVSKYLKNKRSSMALLEPVTDDEIISNKYIYCTNDGDVYQMVCGKDSINIYKLVFTNYERTNISANLEKEILGEAHEKSSSDINVLSTHTREEVADSALFKAGVQYDWSWNFDYSIHVSPNNSYCTPPEHLDEPSDSGTVTGIPYKWGGFDDMTSFLGKLEEGKTAGDINANSVTSYTAGIDCSGYISRAYRFASKLGTSNISTYFDSTDYDGLLSGEIANRSGYHVFIFGSYYKENGNIVGCTTLESTTDGGIDATKAWTRSLREMQLYTPMKLKSAYYSNFD
ncbi:MAG: hypothetical protein RR064_02175 [Oscillospiraceae bacterium]